uniref:Uncharacterized protein n=1 Tax=Geospiza parvula TaxID=87175 RepID=A0A8U8B109_GEOPR
MAVATALGSLGLNKFPIPPWRNWLLGHTAFMAPRTKFSTDFLKPWLGEWGVRMGTAPWGTP